MKRFLVGVARFFMNLLYKLCDVLPRRKEIMFFSRQANEPSVDFKMLGNEFTDRGFKVSYLTKKLSAKTLVPYFFFAIKEIYHLARCRVCVVDRYDPVICLLDFKTERYVGALDEDIFHREFPVEPLIIQLWHAYGAFKKFGYQSLGTIEGHTRENAEVFRIHKNYSYVFCTGEENRAAFSEAFSYPMDRIVAMGRPELDLLANSFVSKTHITRERKVMFAPTLRKSKQSQHPMVQLYESESWKPLEQHAEVVWSFHPLKSVGVASGSINEKMIDADIVVTDYSSIVYEAYMLGKKILFYIPDIEDYETSPGLNVNPLKMCPDLVCLDDQELISKILYYLNSNDYPQEQFDRFVGSTFEVVGNNTTRIVDFICSHV